MKNVHFSGLDISIPLKDNQFFHDDGVVGNIAHYNDRLNARYGSQKRFNGDADTFGITLIYKQGERQHFHIGRARLQKDAQEILAQGHEETHVLDFLGKLEFLEQAILDRQGKAIDMGAVETELAKDRSLRFDLLSDEERKGVSQEVIAELGSIFALAQRDIGPQRTSYSLLCDGHMSFIDKIRLFPFHSTYFKKALQIYKEADR